MHWVRAAHRAIFRSVKLHRRGALRWPHGAYKQRVQKLLEHAQITQIAQKCTNFSGRAPIIIFYPSWVLTSWCLFHGDCLKKLNPIISSSSNKNCRLGFWWLFYHQVYSIIPFSLIPLFLKFHYPLKSLIPCPKFPFPKSQMHQTLVSYLKFPNPNGCPKSFMSSFDRVYHHSEGFHHHAKFH